MKLRHAVALLASALTIAGCQLDVSPITSATMSQYVSGRPEPSVTLRSEKVQALSSWIAEHRSGWSPSFVSYAPSLEIRLTHAAGETSVMNIDSKKVVIYNRSGQLEQEFPSSSLSALRSAIGGAGG